MSDNNIVSHSKGNPFLEKASIKKPPTIEDMEQVKCDSCGNIAFDKFYKVYKYIEPDTKELQLYYIPLEVCASCQTILDRKKLEESE